MVEEGARVRLKSTSRLARQHPEMAQAVAVVGSVVRGTAWSALGASNVARLRDTTMHLRFAALNLVALNVPAADVEAVDHLDPVRA